MRALFFARKKIILIFTVFFLLIYSLLPFVEKLYLKQNIIIMANKASGAKVFNLREITFVVKKPVPAGFAQKALKLYQQEKKYFNSSKRERVVVVVQDSSSLQGFSLPSSGYYWGGVVYLFSGAENEALAHELAHYLLDINTNGRLSRYLHEGFAQWFEINLGSFPPFLQDNEAVFLSPASLEKNLDSSENQYAAYQESYYFIKYLEGKKGIGGLYRFLNEVKKNGEGKAFVAVFGENEDLLFKEFVRWYQEWKKSEARASLFLYSFSVFG